MSLPEPAALRAALLASWPAPGDASGLGRAGTELIMAARVLQLAVAPAPVTLFPVWPPLQILHDIWAESGIGAAQQAAMARAPMPRTALLARLSDRAAGAAFVVCHGRIAVLHAVAVRPSLRRRGAARALLTGAAWWAQGQGMDWLAIEVTRADHALHALCTGAGLCAVGRADDAPAADA